MTGCRLSLQAEVVGAEVWRERSAAYLRSTCAHQACSATHSVIRLPGGRLRHTSAPTTTPCSPSPRFGEAPLCKPHPRQCSAARDIDRVGYPGLQSTYGASEMRNIPTSFAFSPHASVSCASPRRSPLCETYRLSPHGSLALRAHLHVWGLPSCESPTRPAVSTPHRVPCCSFCSV